MEDLSNIQVPYNEVTYFMKNLEKGISNSDNTAFYKYLSEKDNFDEVFDNT